MEIRLMKKVLEFFRDTDVEEFHWEKDGSKIIFQRGAVPLLKKNSDQRTEQTLIESAQNKSDESDALAKKIFTIKSPMVGTFYRSNAVSRPPLLEEGKIIKVGQKVCMIEAMKVNKDVVADKGGKVLKVLIENGRPVEYGQDLFLVELEDNV
ncbi:MAG: biotin/lipoyl-containing protein [Elusimicrobiota bacterium]